MESSHSSARTSNEEEVFEKSRAIYEEIISTLPQEHGWNFSQPCCLYQGFWLPPFFLEGAMFAQDNFKAQPHHIFLCSAPKTGTTWLKALAYATVTRSQFENSINHSLTKLNPHDCVPFLERDYFENYPTMPERGLPLWSTHLPYSLLPKSIIHSNCKIIYICRDPKDVFVSFWYFVNKLVPKKVSLEEAFELYCNGTYGYGPYWDHVLGYWKVSLDRPNMVFFVKYEDMMADTAVYLRKLAEFMGCPFSLEEESEGAIEKIVDLCSFEKLSNLEVNKEGKHRSNAQVGGVENKFYFRNGKVGDWKIHLTTEMESRLDKIMERKFSGSGFMFNSNLH